VYSVSFLLLSHTFGQKNQELLKIPLGSLSFGSLFSRIHHHHHHREEEDKEEEDKEREYSPSESKAEELFEDDLVAKQPDPTRRTRKQERE